MQKLEMFGGYVCDWLTANGAATVLMADPSHTASRERLFRALSRIHAACKSLDMRGSCAILLRLIYDIENRDPNRLKNLCHSLADAMELSYAEMDDLMFMYLPRAAHDLFDNKKPFGDPVWAAFPEAIYDAEEAAKCLALDRATASVFHSMRATEFGLRRLIADSFGDAAFFDGDPKTWGVMVNRIRREANKGDTQIARPWVGKQDRLTKLALLVDQVREAFRNPTMHCGGPYAVEQANDIFQATGAFLRRLSEDFDGAADGQEPKNPENSEGPQNPDPHAGGRAAQPDRGGEI